MDRYIIRKAILKSVKSSLTKMNGRMLDFGCGGMPYKRLILSDSNVSEYVGLDIEGALSYNGTKPDAYWDGVNMPFSDDEFESTFGTEVLEHCPDPELILKELHRVLKKGGYLFATVPFVWPLHESPADEFRYTPYSLKRLLMKAGFRDVEIIPHGGWNATLAQLLGLWCRRAYGRKWIKKLLSIWFFPLYYLLLRTDRGGQKYWDNFIAPGWSIHAYK